MGKYMRYVQVVNNIVSNIILCDDSNYASNNGFIQAPATVNIGWLYDGADFIPQYIPPTIMDFENAVQLYLDSYAQSWKYESILSAATYLNSTNIQYQKEAAALIPWRDQVWSNCYITLAAVEANTMPMPSNTATFISTLPQPPARPV
jgi:hypothetical protein